MKATASEGVRERVQQGGSGCRNVVILAWLLQSRGAMAVDLEGSGQITIDLEVRGKQQQITVDLELMRADLEIRGRR